MKQGDKRVWKGDGRDGYATVTVIKPGDYKSLVRIEEVRNDALKPDMAAGDEIEVLTDKLYPLKGGCRKCGRDISSKVHPYMDSEFQLQLQDVADAAKEKGISKERFLKEAERAYRS